MKKNAIVFGTVLAMFGSLMLGGCQKTEPTQVASVEKGYWEAQEMDKITGTDFTVVAENDTMQLLIKPKTGTLRWMDKETGVYRDTNLSEDEVLDKITDSEKSDLIVSYYTGTHSQPYKSYSSYDSYSMGVQQKSITYQLMDNGVRVVYRLGNSDVTYKNFPKSISGERMQELVLQYLDDKQLETLKNTYYSQLTDGSWSRKFNTSENSTNQLGSLQAQEVYSLFYETGHYTIDELYADLEAIGADESDYPSNLSIVVPVEYTIEDNQLLVNVDTSLMETDSANPIRNLTLLPYFLTSDTGEEAEEGYMFIPDSSGALIYLDSTKTKEYHYAASWYHGDKLISATSYSSTDNTMMLPVFGMKNSTGAVFGIIEEGAEAAALDAYVSGTDNSEPFCKMKLTFDIQPQQVLSAASKSAFSIYKASDDIYDENITIRYFWLDEDATWVDMADCYSDYLEAQGVLTAKTADEKASFFVELLGMTDKTQYMLGIPYDGTEVLTTFKEAQEVLKDLDTANVENIKLIYSGMVNGGMNQRALTKGVSLASGLGGKSAYQSLTSYADSIGAEVFPNLMLQSAYTKKNLGSDVSAWNIVNERAQIYSFDPVTTKYEDDSEYPLYIINPSYIEKYLDQVKSSLTSRTGQSNLASGDLLTFIGTNYMGKQVSISTGKDIYTSAAAKLAEGMNLMLSNPMAEAYAYSQYLTDIPTTDSGMRVLDASVPFIQTVLDGYLTYSTESLNLETTDITAEFMRAIESKSAPKFTFTYRDSTRLAKTEQDNLFAVDYTYWKDEIGSYYEEYNSFYEQVKDAQIAEHELYNRDENLRIVTWSNGVKVYLNYSDQDETIDGVSVPAFSYKIEG